MMKRLPSAVRMRMPLVRDALLLAFVMPALPARADTPALPASAALAEPSVYLAVGAAASVGPEYPGSDKRSFSVAPLLGLRYGRLRISSSRASSLLGPGSEGGGAGASADLVSTSEWKAGAALRVDQGRSSADSDALAGLPDVPPTVRGRFFVSYKVNADWSFGASVAQDLLGRDGGAFGNLDATRRGRLSERITWSAGVGLSLADRRYMRSFFGISDAVAKQTGRNGGKAYSPGDGLKDVSTGAELTIVLSPSWVAFAGAGVYRLLGQAAASPLTRSASGFNASAGIAYRWSL